MEDLHKEPELPWWQDPLYVLKLIQLIIPLVLFFIVFFYEADEHMVLDSGIVRFHFASEILFFGLAGPGILFIIFGYIRRLLSDQIKARENLSTLNVDLEQKVAARTIALEERNTELTLANDELKELDKMKSDFVTLVSHELRAPLTVMNGGLELIAQQADVLPAATRRTIDVMVLESDRLTRMVQTILDLSRLEAGKIQLTLGPTAVLPVLERVTKSTLLDNERKIINIVDPDLPPVWADEAILEEVLCNLVQNALKYSPHSQPIHLAAHLENESVSISVIDHGLGIPTESQDRLFEQFFRGSYSQNTAPGWGLGLYFARKLTEAQGGSIQFKSPCWPDLHNPGSQFTITLRVAESPDEDDALEAPGYGGNLTD
jgi:signal transduction histidine kinase